MNNPKESLPGIPPSARCDLTPEEREEMRAKEAAVKERDIEKMLSTMEIGENFEMPHLGRKNCDWCWGKGFANVNGAVQVCKCLTPKTDTQKEAELGRLKPTRMGKHTKGRSRWFGKNGTWKKVPADVGPNSTPAWDWRFIPSDNKRHR